MLFHNQILSGQNLPNALLSSLRNQPHASSSFEEDTSRTCDQVQKKVSTELCKYNTYMQKGKRILERVPLRISLQINMKARPPKSTLVWLKSKRVYFEAGRPRVHQLTRRDGHSDLTLWPLPTLLLLLLFVFFPPPKNPQLLLDALEAEQASW